ncbi:membrane lipoprotein lipid attachment site-containing protein, partial [Vibrio parahaemolyticus]|nr:membrane lipoprotein lipid attachment site-containing protein [Vibrio parahaemolyticus]
MKKFFFVLLSVFILSGCGQDDVPQFALDPVTSQNGSDNVTLRVNPTNLIIKNGKSKELQAFLVHADGTETSVKAN